jgi:hypothetical protein
MYHRRKEANMCLSRRDLVPVLTIITGGAVGALLTFNPLVPWSPDGDVPALDPVVAPSETAEPMTRGVLESDAIGVPTLSPDGRWLAYVSDETGSNEVYVRAFPDVNSGKWQVSTDGGVMPMWADSGRELYYLDDNLGLVAAQVYTDSGFRVRVLNLGAGSAR